MVPFRALARSDQPANFGKKAVMDQVNFGKWTCPMPHETLAICLLLVACVTDANLVIKMMTKCLFVKCVYIHSYSYTMRVSISTALCAVVHPPTSTVTANIAPKSPIVHLSELSIGCLCERVIMVFTAQFCGCVLHLLFKLSCCLCLV